MPSPLSRLYPRLQLLYERMILFDQVDQITCCGGRIRFAGLPCFDGSRGDAEDRGKCFLCEVQLFARPGYVDFRKVPFSSKSRCFGVSFHISKSFFEPGHDTLEEINTFEILFDLGFREIAGEYRFGHGCLPLQRLLYPYHIR